MWSNTVCSVLDWACIPNPSIDPVLPGYWGDSLKNRLLSPALATQKLPAQMDPALFQKQLLMKQGRRLPAASKHRSSPATKKTSTHLGPGFSSWASRSPLTTWSLSVKKGRKRRK